MRVATLQGRLPRRTPGRGAPRRRRARPRRRHRSHPAGGARRLGRAASRTSARSPRSSTPAQVTGEPVGPRAPARRRSRAPTSGSTASAYLNHVRLVRKARGAEPPATLETDPLVYQGGSGVLLGPARAIPLADPAWGLDFEARGLRRPRRRAAAARAPPTPAATCGWYARERRHAAKPDPRRAREGLRLLPGEARDRVLALRGDARRARPGVEGRPRAPAAARRPTTASGRRLRRRARDALLVLRSPRSTSRGRAPSPPAPSSAAARSRTRTARAASRASPSGGCSRSSSGGEAADAVHEGRATRSRSRCSTRAGRSIFGKIAQKVVADEAPHGYWRSRAPGACASASQLKGLAYDYAPVNLLEGAAAARRDTARRTRSARSLARGGGGRPAVRTSSSRWRSWSGSRSASRRRRSSRPIRWPARAGPRCSPST